LLSLSNIFAQVGIGTENPAPSAMLEISSTNNNKGVLIPRISATQKDAILSPAQGLLIYQTTAPIGFYYFMGSSWNLMLIQTDITNKVDKVDGKDLSTNDYSTIEKNKLAAITGTNTGDQTNISGNAATATKLAASKNINGVAFDGSADINIAATASAEQLTGTTLKSTVTGSSLTSVGTLTDLSVSNPIVGSITSTAENVRGLIAIANGGTGLSAPGSNGQVLTSNGSTLSWASPAISGISSLNGSNTSTQTFATPGTTGLAPAWSTASGAHTLSIPLASATSVTAGLLSKADYDNFTSAYTNRITSLTTTGSSGAATLVSNVLNIPSPTLNELAGTKALNTIYAGPVSGANATPTFRALVAADFPTLNQNTSGTAASATNIAGGLGGTIPYQTAANTTAMLANGTNGQVLTSQGTTLAPVWRTSSGVPYTGATGAVNLGAYDLTVDGISVGTGNGTDNANTALGFATLRSNTGTNNTSIGSYSQSAIPLSGNDNSSLGASSLYYNSVGNNNTAIGSGSLFYNENSGNTAIGNRSLFKNVSGTNNTAIGNGADVATAALTNATAIGNGASVEASNSIQLGNTSVTAVNTSGAITGLSFIKSGGTAAQFLKANGTVDGSTYLTSASTATSATNIAGGLGGTIPYQTAANTTAMLANGTSGQVLTSQGTTLAPVWATSSGVPYTGATGAVNLGAYDLTLQGLKLGLGGGAVAGNITFGTYSLLENTTGLNNIGIGNNAGRSNQTGSHNVSIGKGASYYSTGSGLNTAVGVETLFFTTSGSSNSAFGYQSLKANTTGANNIAIGEKALLTNTTGSNNTAIGYNANVASNNLTNATAIGNGASVEASNTIQLGNTSVIAVKTSGALNGGNTATSTVSGFAANINTITGASYSLTAADNGKIITLNNASAITLTVPSLFAGFNCMIVQLGAGAVTLTASGVTISNRNSFTKTAGTNAIATLIALTSTTFISAGDMQ
jgi:hypothetical protein